MINELVREEGMSDENFRKLTAAEYKQRVKNSLDIKAFDMDYDNIATACSYVNSTNVDFAADGAKFIALRDRVWENVYANINIFFEENRDVIEGVEENIVDITWQSLT
jgi:hypothetical protein